MKQGTWTNGKKTVTGRYSYSWAESLFRIELDMKDKITGENKRIEVTGDTPEWGNWKKVEK